MHLCSVWDFSRAYVKGMLRKAGMSHVRKPDEARPINEKEIVKTLEHCKSRVSFLDSFT